MAMCIISPMRRNGCRTVYSLLSIELTLDGCRISHVHVLCTHNSLLSAGTVLGRRRPVVVVMPNRVHKITMASENAVLLWI